MLPAVHPDDVRRWAASADVSIIAVPANSLNQRLSTPNKFWESLAAGTPVVIGRDLEVMRAIVETGDLGAVADPLDPGDLARALREILDLPAAAYDGHARSVPGDLARPLQLGNRGPAVSRLVARLQASPAAGPS